MMGIGLLVIPIDFIRKLIRKKQNKPLGVQVGYNNKKNYIIYT